MADHRDQTLPQTMDAQGTCQAPTCRTRALLQPSQTSEEKPLFPSEITSPPPASVGVGISAGLGRSGRSPKPAPAAQLCCPGSAWDGLELHEAAEQHLPQGWAAWSRAFAHPQVALPARRGRANRDRAQERDREGQGVQLSAVGNGDRLLPAAWQGRPAGSGLRSRQRAFYTRTRASGAEPKGSTQRPLPARSVCAEGGNAAQLPRLQPPLP